MQRFVGVLVLVALSMLIAGATRADEFDHYLNKVLGKVPKAKGVQRVKKLTRAMLVDHGGVLKDSTAAFVVVRTNGGRWAKLLVHPARQKISKTESAPILLIERFVTYKIGTDKAVLAEGKDVRLFKDFVFNLDLGQVVPAAVGGDLRFVVGKNSVETIAVGKAELYLLGKPLRGVVPEKTKKLVIRDPFVPQYFTGAYKIYDDGRRTGEIHLKVGDNNLVTGHYYSGKDGRKYKISGKVSDPHHRIQFKITFPRTVQTFQGWMFTGDGKAITGYARMQQRETGFYALRVGDK